MASGLLVRDSALLLVYCRYKGQSEPLWTLPGGRQEPGELLVETVRREFHEETSLDVEPHELAYLSESIDQQLGVQVTNATFWVREVDTQAKARGTDPKVVEARFVALEDAPTFLRADVLRIPVTAALGASKQRYFRFKSEDVEVPFFASASRAKHD